MDTIPLWFVLPTVLILSSLCAAYAAILWLRGSAAGFPMNRLRSLEIALADLRSAHESLHQAHLRMHARLAMRDHRARTAEEKPPGTPPAAASPFPNESKESVRRRLGLFGGNAARAAQQIHAAVKIED
jgi:hypothetical protein